MKKYVKGLFFSLVVLMVVIVAGCSNGESADEGDTIKIGSMFELTGSAAAYGTSMNIAVSMAVL